MKVGKTLAFTSISFRNEKNELVARGSHTKSVDLLIFTYIFPYLYKNPLTRVSTSRYVQLAWGDKKNIVDQLAPLKESS